MMTMLFSLGIEKNTGTGSRATGTGSSATDDVTDDVSKLFFNRPLLATGHPHVYELQNRHIHSTRPRGHVTHFLEK